MRLIKCVILLDNYKVGVVRIIRIGSLWNDQYLIYYFLLLNFFYYEIFLFLISVCLMYKMDIHNFDLRNDTQLFQIIWFTLAVFISNGLYFTMLSPKHNEARELYSPTDQENVIQIPIRWKFKKCYANFWKCYYNVEIKLWLPWFTND